MTVETRLIEIELISSNKYVYIIFDDILISF